MSPGQRNKPPRPQRGFALLATLWVTVMLGVILGSMSYQVRVEATLQRQILDNTTLRLAARGALHTGIATLRAHVGSQFHHRNDDWWSDEDNWRNIVIGETTSDIVFGNYSHNVADETPDSGSASDENDTDSQRFGPRDGESLLNINSASAEQLIAIPGLDESIVDSLIEWRDSLHEDTTTSGTADNGESDTTDADYPPLVEPVIVSLHSLTQLQDFDHALLYPDDPSTPGIDHYLTTHSSGRININTADPIVLQSTGLQQAQIDQLLQARQSAPIESRGSIASVLGIDENSETWQQLEPVLDIRSYTFELISHTRLGERNVYYQISAVCLVQDDAIAISSWREQRLTGATGTEVNVSSGVAG